MFKYLLTTSLILTTASAWASQPIWVDKQHAKGSQKIDKLANKINNLLGEHNPDEPASASLRLIMDSKWNRHDGWQIKPRVRGNLRLPVLEEKVSVVFGDEALDNEILDGKQDERHTVQAHEKMFDKKQMRDENSSLALRWSKLNKRWKLDTDADVGLRSGSDVYLRLKARKQIQHRPNLSTEMAQIYRYGAKSRHFARSSVEVKKQQNPRTFIANYVHADYVDNKNEKAWSWGKNVYRQHQFHGSRKLVYGVQAGGAISGKGRKFNSYGAFATWRQAVWRNWVFVQTDLTYANDRDAQRRHHAKVGLRLEAIL